MSAAGVRSLIGMKTTMTLFAILSLALVAACEKKEETTQNPNEPVVAAKPGEPAAPSATAPGAPAAPIAAAGEAIGVAECDAYVTKYQACLDKVPADQKPTLQKTFEDQKTAWKTAATTPEGKTGLAQACTAAIESAKTATSAYGCAF